MDEYIKRAEAIKRIRIDAPSKYPNTFILGLVAAADELVTIPAAQVVDADDYTELLHAARKMHEWIFLHTGDEQEAYDECGLSDEMNTLLGYGGRIEIGPLTKEDDHGR